MPVGVTTKTNQNENQLEYRRNNNWNTVETTEVTSHIAKLLGTIDAKLLRIGNDDSSEEEMGEMDGILINSRLIKPDIIGNSELILFSHPNGNSFVREMKDDVVAYYAINKGPEDWFMKDFGPRGAVNETITNMDSVKGTENRGGAYHADTKLGILTLQELKKMKPGVFAWGEIENSEDGLFMVNSNIGKKLLWIAKRGGFHDWAIYTHWADNGFDYVLSHGDKVGISNVRKLINCTDDALEMYRK